MFIGNLTLLEMHVCNQVWQTVWLNDKHHVNIREFLELRPDSINVLGLVAGYSPVGTREFTVGGECGAVSVREVVNYEAKGGTGGNLGEMVGDAGYFCDFVTRDIS